MEGIQIRQSTGFKIYIYLKMTLNVFKPSHFKICAHTVLHKYRNFAIIPGQGHKEKVKIRFANFSL